MTNLTETLKGSMSVSSRTTSRTSISMGRKLAAPKAKVTLIKRADQGWKTGAENEASAFADGTYLYLKMHKDLWPPNQYAMPTIVESVLAATDLSNHDLLSAGAHDVRGWLFQCTSIEVVNSAAGKTLSHLGTEATLSLYHSGGAQAFITDKALKNDFLLASGIALAIKGYSFWLGKEEHRGIAGGRRVVIFHNSPNIYKFEVPVKRAPGYEHACMVRFRAVDRSASKCDICLAAGHATVRCPLLHTVHLKGQEASECLLGNQPTLQWRTPVVFLLLLLMYSLY